MFFDGLHGLLRLLVVGSCAYVSLVLLLRISGKRTLSKMNASDFVVTVALGSTLATILLSSEVSLAEGILAFVLLIALQFAVTWASFRSPRFQAWVKADPALLFHSGHFLEAAMRRERVTHEEVRSALRGHGFADGSDVSVVLETDGTISVVQAGAAEGRAATRTVRAAASAT